MPVINEKKIKNFLDTALETIRTEADPHLLNQYRALIRKNVSFFQRSYLAAYLLMLQEQPQGRQRKFGGGEPGGKTESARQGQRPAQQPSAPVALPEDESAKLFINIGRNRRVFPREILGLIGARTSVPREDIGTISILNNYSFIQVRSSAAPEILETLNGSSFRGRTLTVNYARVRKEDDEHLPAEPALDFPEEDRAEYGDAGDIGADSGVMDSGAYAESGDTGVDNESGDIGTEDKPDASDLDGDPDDSGETTTR
ncbi:MAG: DbpA RNA binding domain-containing protein [Treponema sp.]|jgi:hypothetical protein|nr:DbpA RNA binding domain-containing protein [Treponema sp.]